MAENILDRVLESIPKSMDDIDDMPLYSILIVLSGYIAIGLGFFNFILQLIGNIDIKLVLHFLINLFFGFGLLLSYTKISDERRKWSVICGILSIILIALGGIVGILAGLIGVIGSSLAFITTIDENFNI
uniref:Membrane protein n=1 Tax=uncultured organism TaxID=155900 RepID=M1QBI4_9ZZZZ|nr:membrane protein [uncultured organism]